MLAALLKAYIILAVSPQRKEEFSMKRVLMVILALIIAIVPLSGCKESGDEISMISVWVDEDGEPVNDGDSDEGTQSGSSGSGGSGGSGGNQGGSGGSGGSQGGSGTMTKPVNGKYDFKGKTYTMAITDEEQYNTTSFATMKSAFEKKYNLKIKTTKLVFQEYNKQVSQKMATGTSYDICYIHGSMFPTCVLDGSVLYNDLTAAIKQVDSKVINADRSKELFAWDGKVYGAIADNSVFVHVMYYNKVLFQSAGLEDPRTIYNNNPDSWTWDKVFEMGTKVAKDGEVFFGHQNEVINIYGENGYYIKDGKFYNNMRSPLIRKGLEHMRKIYVGNDAIGSMSTIAQDYVDGFANGKFYMIIEEHSKYPSLAAAAAKSVNCGKNLKNVGIVPVPLPAENTKKAYPTGWYTAVASGKGSDPVLATLWADFSQGYKSPVKSKYELSDTDMALINKLLAGNTLPVRHGQASNNSIDVTTVYKNILRAAQNGDDINQAIESNYNVINDCITTTVGKDRLVEVK